MAGKAKREIHTRTTMSRNLVMRRTAHQVKWNIYLGGEYITAVWYDQDCSEEYVLRTLIEHDDYHPDIEVRKA
jgi:hypothetical protein